MDKLKDLFNNLSLSKSIIIYITIFVMITLCLCTLTTYLCSNVINNIYNSYPSKGEKYYLTNEKGEQLGEGTYIGTDIQLSKKDEQKIALLEFIPIITTPIYSALCIITAALLFYHNKLKKPITLLKDASNKILENNLDFSIDYNCKDELGQLCKSFEIMRSTLENNFSEMWRQMEARKQLNAIFAHDLRTPLTVLKGYNEILQASCDTYTKTTAITMGKHILRLEYYVNSMSNLQRLEDMQPEYKSVSLQSFLDSLYESANILCKSNNKKFYLFNKTVTQKLFVDTKFISEVIDNLVSNAIRYAAFKVTLCIEEVDNGLLLSVSDDGKGFSESSLQKAINPYFTEEKNHFGLGLYICKMLCEHHNGYLKFENLLEGAKVSAFFKIPIL